MVKRLLLGPALALAALPAAAQAATPAENLDCAIWTSATMDENNDPEVVTGLGYTLSWFIGLYEGATGQSIDDAMVARAVSMTDAEFSKLEPICIKRMQGFGDRLSTLANRLAAQGT